MIKGTKMKYLIASEYRYYDDFDFSNVCVCDTRERAEELVQEFKNNIEIFKNTQGYEIYIDKDVFDETIFSDFEDIIVLKDIVRVFVKSDIFDRYKEALENTNVSYEEINFYNFLINARWNNKSDDIRSRYCNHEEAVLDIYEIPSM